MVVSLPVCREVRWPAGAAALWRPGRHGARPEMFGRARGSAGGWLVGWWVGWAGELDVGVAGVGGDGQHAVAAFERGLQCVGEDVGSAGAGAGAVAGQDVGAAAGDGQPAVQALLVVVGADPSVGEAGGGSTRPQRAGEVDQPGWHVCFLPGGAVAEQEAVPQMMSAWSGNSRVVAM